MQCKYKKTHANKTKSNWETITNLTTCTAFRKKWYSLQPSNWPKCVLIPTTVKTTQTKKLMEVALTEADQGQDFLV